MWGAIIQAIDHALGRMHEGAGAGIKVANSQHGSGAPISNMDAKETGEAARSLMQKQDTTSDQDEAAEKAKIGSNSTSTGEDAGGQAASGAGALGSIGNLGGGASEGEAAGGADVASAASSILSDETAKSAQNASTNTNQKSDDAAAKKAARAGKFAAARQYGAGVGKGFANAGAIATGNKAAEWEDIDNSAAKKAAEETVKNWRKRDFNKQADASTAEEK